nr:tail fiber domain-containing protein [uncultured Dyadobacter sp.]
MKIPLIVSVIVCTALLAHAQAPQKFSFQGVARKADGKIAANTAVGIRISILAESAGGTIVYRETHSAQTNDHGIFNIRIGSGTVVSGEFSGISWKTFEHFLQLELDVAGGTNYADMGTTQLLSVPYALHAGEASRWADGYPVVQKLTYGPDVDPSDPGILNDPDFKKYQLPVIGIGDRLIWYPFKGAFRAGKALNDKWEDSQIGLNSVAFGVDNLAKGNGAAVLGASSQATGFNAVAMGKEVSAIGYESLASGFHTSAKARASWVSGSYNDVSDNPSPASENPLDRIFQIGNGDENVQRNAVTVLRNGNVGIGSTALSPSYLLDVGGRPRIRHSGVTAGIHFNNSTNGLAGFVGMVNDNRIGLYVGNQWLFQVADNGSVAAGNVVLPQGVGSVSLGASTAAIGDGSGALGTGTVAKGFGAVALGAYNNVQDNNTVGSLAGAKTSDRVFQIGNGLGPQALSNAVTVLRNGNVGIGNNALVPLYTLEVGGRTRIHHNGSTAGIYFDNSQHAVDGFVGMKTDNEVGFYLGNSWKFWVDNGGSGYINGVLVQTSDRRLKRDFTSLSNSLAKIAGLQGLHYYWKDKAQDQSLQTGLIAQEVEELFPELVKTDEKGFKSLNYTGLIPHLIESVKELVKENQQLKGHNTQLRSQSESAMERIGKLEAKIGQWPAAAAGK